MKLQQKRLHLAVNLLQSGAGTCLLLRKQEAGFCQPADNLITLIFKGTDKAVKREIQSLSACSCSAGCES